MEKALDPQKQNQTILDSVKKSIERTFPVESGNRKIIIQDVSIEDNLSDTDFPTQKEIKLNRKTWDLPIKATIKLVDEKGKVLDKAENVNVGRIPKLTNRLSTIIKGNEYQVSNQFRRKPGAYSRVKRNGELESEFNLSKGANFAIDLNPENKKFTFSIKGATKKYHLWNLLDILGVTDTQVQNT